MFVKKFEESPHGKILLKDLSVPFDKASSPHSAINHYHYSLSKWSLFRACIRRELLLMKRNTFIYVFKSVEVNFLPECLQYKSKTSFKTYKFH